MGEGGDVSSSSAPDVLAWTASSAEGRNRNNLIKEKEARKRSGSAGTNQQSQSSQSPQSPSRGRGFIRSSIRNLFFGRKGSKHKRGSSAENAQTSSIPPKVPGYKARNSGKFQKNGKSKTSSSVRFDERSHASSTRSGKSASTASSFTVNSSGSIYSKQSGSIKFTKDNVNFSSETDASNRDIFAMSVGSRNSLKRLSLGSVNPPPASPLSNAATPPPAASTPSPKGSLYYTAYSAPRSDFIAAERTEIASAAVSRRLSCSAPVTPEKHLFLRQVSVPPSKAVESKNKGLSRATSEFASAPSRVPVTYAAPRVNVELEKSMDLLMRLRAQANSSTGDGTFISAEDISLLLKTVSSSLIHNEAYHVRDMMAKRQNRKGKHKTLTRGIEAYFFHELNLHKAPRSASSVASETNSVPASLAGEKSRPQSIGITSSSSSRSLDTVDEAEISPRSKRQIMPCASEPALVTKHAAMRGAILRSRNAQKSKRLSNYAASSSELQVYDGSLRMLLPSGSTNESSMREDKEKMRSFSFTVPSVEDAPEDYDFLTSMMDARPGTATLLDQIGKWDFDIFLFSETVASDPMTVMGLYLMEHENLFSELSLSRVSAAHFMRSIESRYLSNYYHNALHAADVAHGFMHFLHSGTLASLLPAELRLGCILAAICHDVAHPGVSNQFLIATKNPLAIRYNDASPLENMHCCITFETMNLPNCNLIGDIPVRRTIIDLIMSTDMAVHNEILGTLNSRVKSFGNIDPTSTDRPIVANHKQPSDQTLILMGLLHAADVGNPAKPWVIYQKWTERVVAEFFIQGDRERDLGFEPLDFMDRSKYNLLPVYQINFMDFVVIRLYETLAQLEPYVNLKVCMDNVTENHSTWEAELEEVEEARRLSAADDDAGIVMKSVNEIEELEPLVEETPSPASTPSLSAEDTARCEDVEEADLGEPQMNAAKKGKLMKGRRALSERLPRVDTSERLLTRKTVSDSPRHKTNSADDVGTLFHRTGETSAEDDSLTPRSLVRKSMNRAKGARMRRESSMK